MIPSETTFTTHQAYVDHGFEWYDLKITCQFDTPPPVMVPSRVYAVTAHMSHDGTNTQGGEGLGEAFQYRAQRGYESIIDPHALPGAPLRYSPWHPDFDGTATKEWKVTAPPIANEGDTFDLYAGLWNRPPCHVVWTYRAE
jgi:hypothetical protein